MSNPSMKIAGLYVLKNKTSFLASDVANIDLVKHIDEEHGGVYTVHAIHPSFEYYYVGTTAKVTNLIHVDEVQFFEEFTQA